MNVFLTVTAICLLILLPISEASHEHQKWHKEDEDGWSDEARERNHKVKTDSRPNIVLFYCDDVSGIKLVHSIQIWLLYE